MFKVKMDDEYLDPVKELNVCEKICTYTLGFICVFLTVLMFIFFIKLLVPCDYIFENEVSTTNNIISISSDLK